MKIAIIGDTHLGFGFGTPREEDSFRNAKEAISKALEEKPDIIVQMGDMFHDRIPKPEILAPGIEIFSKASSKLKPLKIFQRIREHKEEQLTQRIPAIISIFGNHERRSTQYVNPVQIVEKSESIYCMTAESIVVENSVGERIGIHGLSSVPNGVCAEVLKAWNPKPFPNMANIMLLHQNFREVIPVLGTDVPSYSDLPDGFDVYLCGDIHWRVEDKHPVSNAPIIFTGSTVKTQLKKLESKQTKGIYLLDFNSKPIKITLKELSSPRPFFYHGLDISDQKPSEIIMKIDQDLAKRLQYYHGKLKPIVRYKLKGKLAEGFLPTDLSPNKLIKKYENEILVFIDKSKITSSKLTKRAKFLLDLKDKRVSVEQLGLKILCENMGTKDFQKIESILLALSQNDIKKARELLD